MPASNSPNYYVKCTKIVPDREIFVIGETYEVHGVSRGGSKATVWVGIQGTGGHDFAESDLDKYFEKV